MPSTATQASERTRPKAHRSGREKAVPKRPLSVSEQQKHLFTSLCAQIDGGHYRNGIKTCDKILRLDPNDKDALQTKAFLLLQTEQYDAALKLVEAPLMKSDYVFEKAYSLYRGQREREAREVLQTIKGTGGHAHRGALHLEAQLEYREGACEAALNVYQQLLDTVDPQSEEQTDILTNIEAVQQHLDFISTGFLHAIDSLPRKVVDEIKTAPPPAQSVPTQPGTLAQPALGAPNETGGSTPKKTRTSRIPPNVIPGVTPLPDPERWLKKSERTNYGQGKKKKGQGGSGGATQGNATLDVIAPPSVGQTPGKVSGAKGKKKR